MASDFYNWSGRNGVDWQKNSGFLDTNAFTWNYSLTRDSVTNEFLPGYWRGIYKYFYDTDRPHTNPWEMLGHKEKPTNWETNYGPAPYTAGNEVMWSDIANGYDLETNTTTSRYIRSGLLDYLPVDDNGNLKTPIAIGFVQGDTIRNISRNFVFGDQGPGETAWRRSSSYPFSVIKTLK